jgi:nicotinamide-nucleotide amidase
VTASGPRVHLVVVGDEILDGRTVDSNAAHAARTLFERGARVTGIRAVGDDPAVIAAALSDAAAAADLVLVSGGLGPTEDDRTREGLARAMGVPVVEDAAARALVAAALERRGRPYSAAHARMALLPRGARAVENPAGTAPAVDARLGASRVLLLPGVPAEFRALLEPLALAALREAGALPETAACSVFVAGRVEADVGAAVRDLMRADEPRVGSYPAEGEVELRIVARGAGAAARAGAVAAEIRRRLGADVVGEEPLARTVVATLRARGLRVTAAESVTGGLVASLLTDVPGASEVFPGSFVAYSDAFKRDALGVSPDALAREGAVSEAVARAMAEGALARSGADVALATTGSAGPDPAPSPTGPVEPGTVHLACAVRGAPTLHARTRLSGTSREQVRRRAAKALLDLLRRALLVRGG